MVKERKIRTRVPEDTRKGIVFFECGVTNVDARCKALLAENGIRVVAVRKNKERSPNPARVGITVDQIAYTGEEKIGEYVREYRTEH